MRSAFLISLGVMLAGSFVRGDEKQPAEAAKEAPPPSKESYVKIRVEVEVRGTLRVTEKGITVTAQQRIYNMFHPNEENSDWSRPASYTLDFVRNKDLRELATALNGKEVIVTAMAEVRRYIDAPKLPPGGVGSGPFPITHPVPSWHLEPKVQVTGLKLAVDPQP